jgi:hypothetical protein
MSTTSSETCSPETSVFKIHGVTAHKTVNRNTSKQTLTAVFYLVQLLSDQHKFLNISKPPQNPRCKVGDRTPNLHWDPRTFGGSRPGDRDVCDRALPYAMCSYCVSAGDRHVGFCSQSVAWRLWRNVRQTSSWDRGTRRQDAAWFVLLLHITHCPDDQINDQIDEACCTHVSAYRILVGKPKK